MAVVGKAVPRSAGRRGDWTEKGHTYTGTYTVKTDDPKDGVTKVLLADGLPQRGSYYRYGNDFDTGSFRDQISAALLSESGSEKIWIVTANWEPPKNGRPDDNGEDTDDPLRWADEVESFSVKRSIPVEEARNIEAHPNRAIGTVGLVTNSAGVPFNPQPEMDRSLSGMRITKYRRRFPDIHRTLFVDAINSTDFWIIKPGLDRFIKKYTAKCEAINGTLQRHEGQPYWKIKYELLIDDWLTWRPRFVDRGLHAAASEGDPHGFGKGIYGSDHNSHQPPVRRMTDQNGQPVDTPVLLDGHGQPLPLGAPPVYLRYGVYREQEFRVMQL